MIWLLFSHSFRMISGKHYRWRDMCLLWCWRVLSRPLTLVIGLRLVPLRRIVAALWHRIALWVIPRWWVCLISVRICISALIVHWLLLSRETWWGRNNPAAIWEHLTLHWLLILLIVLIIILNWLFLFLFFISIIFLNLSLFFHLRVFFFYVRLFRVLVTHFNHLLLIIH